MRLLQCIAWGKGGEFKVDLREAAEKIGEEKLGLK